MNIQQNIFTVKIITAHETLPLRSRILRPSQPIENSAYNEDSLDSTFHLGVISNDGLNDKIVCNGTFMKDICPVFKSQTTAYRLRGMATDPDFRGRQLGSRLLSEAEKILKEKGCHFLWFNARESAFEFYKKNGYQTVGDMFDIPTIGPHKVMYRHL
jgi:GNAT superfamily N-acetyltransferase